VTECRGSLTSCCRGSVAVGSPRLGVTPLRAAPFICIVYLMSAGALGPKTRSQVMNERQAFDWAVRSLRLYDWDPAVPDKPRFQVNGDSLSFRELCERAKKLDEPLPEVIKYDLYPLLGRTPDLQAKLRLNETYSVAATCLLELLTGRPRN
jgi:hypothetical protein